MEATKKKQITGRLAIIRGHLARVQKMIDDDKYCIDILNQSLAVQRALQKVDNLILDNHLHSCVKDAIKEKGVKGEKAINELLRIYERSAR